MSNDSIPASLRRTVEDDLGPVRPLHPAWLRTIFAVTVAIVVLAAVLAMGDLRTDMDLIPTWLSWGSSGLQLALGFLLIGLALRESVPGEWAPIGSVRLAAGAAVTIQVFTGVATSIYAPSGNLGGSGITSGMGCFTHEAAMALPTFAVTLLLVFRALPLRAPTAGLLGGAGAAVASDAVIHLICPKSDLMHVLVWHTGSVLFFMGLGWIAGVIWRHVRWAHGS